MQVVLGLLFASIINTSSMFSLCLVLTSCSPGVWQKLRKEADGTIERLAAARGVAPDAPLQDKLEALTLDDWESSFDFHYDCLKETMRLIHSGLSYRRVEHTSSGVTDVAGEPLRTGEFAAFLTSNVHKSDNIYVGLLGLSLFHEQSSSLSPSRAIQKPLTRNDGPVAKGRARTTFSHGARVSIPVW